MVRMVSRRRPRASEASDATSKDGPGNREKIRRFLLQSQIQGESPTIREICEAVGLSSPATVHQHLRVLERNGLIQQIETGRSRCWRVIQAPKRGQRIPVVGRIAAGQPIETPLEASAPAKRLDVEFLSISPRAFAASGDVVALLVEGDDMIDAGVLPGDYAIIRRQPRVEAGEIAAVLLGGGGTLKRWREKNQRVALQPANKRFSAISLSKRRGDVQVFGKLVGVVRNY